MRLSRLVAILAAGISVGASAVFLSLLMGAVRQHDQTIVSAGIAETQAAWIEAQVALSVERGLTQIVLEDGQETPGFIKSQLETYRILTDHLIERARALASGIDEAASVSEFLGQSAYVAGKISIVRDKVDRFLAMDSSERDPTIDRELIGDLFKLVSAASVTRDYLTAVGQQHAVYSAALIDMQEHAWEAREFAGRARTNLAVTLLQAEESRVDNSDAVSRSLERVTEAWEKVQVVASQFDVAPEVQAAIQEAQIKFFSGYRKTLEEFRVDEVLTPYAGLKEREAEFKVFFIQSGVALESVTDVSRVIAHAISDYWAERQVASKRTAYFYGASLVLVLAGLMASYIFVKRRIVRRIEKATKVLGAVAEGDLDADVEVKRYDLLEIAALHDTLERFRASLKRAEETERTARTDSMTGLPNRRALDDALAEDAADAFQVGDVFGLLDLDDFKPINDAYGHDVGDAVLREIARRIEAASNGTSAVWRLGGDEFGILWRGFGEEAEAVWAAEQLLETLSQPVKHKGREIYVGASIGVARVDAEMIDPHEVISRADFAMFIAKQRPVNKIELYCDKVPRRNFQVSDRREIMGALDREEFEPFFQPQFSLVTGRLEGFETLARWRTATGEVLTPDKFMSVVEHQQLQSRVDIFMLRKAFANMRAWRERFGATPKVSVNMSEETLASEDSRDAILALFAENADLVDLIVIEVTEDALVDRSANAIRKTLETFIERGVDISMDDFGTGYGSFRHLKEYRFDEVKIDKSFVHSMRAEQASNVIIEGFVAIAKGLNARVVAEGVETPCQLARLREVGCDIGQGYYFGRPATASAAEELLAKGGMFDLSEADEFAEAQSA